MLKVFGFLVKRAGMETRAFIDYYENQQVPWLRTNRGMSQPRAYECSRENNIIN
jgi:hypothetical protein